MKFPQAIKRMRSYVSCCLGFVKIEGECIPKSSQSTYSRPPTPPSSTTETVLPPTEKKDTSIGDSKTVDEAVTEDQREEVTPAAIRLNYGNPLINDELEIPETEDELEQLVAPIFVQR